MSLDAKLVAELKAKHGEDLVGVTAKNETVLVFRKPSRLEYERWFVRDNKDPILAAKELAKACLVHPDEAEFDAVLDAYPAILQCNDGCLPSIIQLAGIGTVRSKNL